MTNAKTIIRLLFLCLAAWTLYSCASIGNPSGGPRDEEPPRFIGSNPHPYATNVKRNRIVLDFDELVNVKDAFQKVVISPTGASTPKVSTQGRRVIIQFQDSLEPNTTYTVDFANSIEDVNEGNKLSSFAYTFSTGEDIDSLQISGIVLNAENLEPQQGILVGVHTNFNDTAFRRSRLVRVAKTDDRGRFTVRGLNNRQPYRVFALKDINNDYRWDNPDEDMAFYPSPVIPSFDFTTVTDSIWDLKNGRVDSVVERQATVFLPNDLLLTSYNINYKPQYLVSYNRIDSTRFSLIFNAPAKNLPEFAIAGAPSIKDWYVAEHNADNDSITLWLKNKTLIQTDTLRLELSYLRTDSARNLTAATDTLRLTTNRQFAKAKKEDKKRKKKKGEQADSVPPTPLIKLTMKTGAQHDIYSPLIFETETPLARIDSGAFHLEQMVDSVWYRLPIRAPRPLDSISVRRFAIDHDWDYGGQYRFTVDSIAVEGIYGLHNASLKHDFKVKGQDEYSNLYLNIIGAPDSVPGYVEILNASDNPVRKARVKNGTASFLNLNPGTYYARFVIDFNGDNLFTPGDYEKGLQPDETYYYPKKLNLRKNWDVEQAWSIYDVAIDMQKPEEIKKNKPERTKFDKEKKVNELDEEDEYFDPTRNPFDPNDRKSKTDKLGRR